MTPTLKLDIPQFLQSGGWGSSRSWILYLSQFMWYFTMFKILLLHHVGLLRRCLLKNFCGRCNDFTVDDKLAYTAVMFQIVYRYTYSYFPVGKNLVYVARTVFCWFEPEIGHLNLARLRRLFVSKKDTMQTMLWCHKA